jgi:hypothetical protein
MRKGEEGGNYFVVSCALLVEAQNCLHGRARCSAARQLSCSALSSCISSFFFRLPRFLNFSNITDHQLKSSSAAPMLSIRLATPMDRSRLI